MTSVKYSKSTVTNITLQLHIIDIDLIVDEVQEEEEEAKTESFIFDTNVTTGKIQTFPFWTRQSVMG